MADKTITVMADFGMGPYAWLKDSSDKTSFVGGNIADAVSGFSGFLPLSARLEHDFSEWVTEFESHYDEHSFDWRNFNSRGVALSKRLKCEVKDAYDVVYVAPSEDPIDGRRLRVEITEE